MAKPFINMSAPAVSYTIDCSAPIADNFFKINDFVEYIKKHMKVAGLRNNLNNATNKVNVEGNEKSLVVTASTKYTKRAVRYYARKFLKKVELRDRFRVVSTGKDTYEFRPYRVDKDE